MALILSLTYVFSLFLSLILISVVIHQSYPLHPWQMIPA